ncbi:hypothetical protein K8I31_20050 [bacterium]|nr:hypothetical protein [bacterium]
MRRHQITPIKLFLATGGLALVIVIVVLMNVLLSDQYAAQNQVVILNIDNDPEIIQKMADAYEQYFPSVNQRIDFEHLTYVPIDEFGYTPPNSSAPGIFHVVKKADADIANFEFEVVIKKEVNPATIRDSEARPLVSYSHCLMANQDNFYVMRRDMYFQKMDKPLFQYNIFDLSDASKTIINPRAIPGSWGKPKEVRSIAKEDLAAGNYHAKTNPLFDPNGLVFGRRVALYGCQIQMQQCVEYPHIILLELNSCIGNRYSNRYWLDQSQGNIWLRAQGTYRKILQTSGYRELTVQTNAEVYNVKQYDGVSIPTRCVVTELNEEGNWLTKFDYCIINMNRITDPTEYFNTLKLEMTPKPEDGKLIREGRFDPVSVLKQREYNQKMNESK